VSDLPGKLTHGQEVMVQGNHVSLVVETLVARGVPKKWIEVTDGAASKKK
jgi:translation initiation factor 2D